MDGSHVLCYVGWSVIYISLAFGLFMSLICLRFILFSIRLFLLQLVRWMTNQVNNLLIIQ
jgi:hypothetical protein